MCIMSMSGREAGGIGARNESNQRPLAAAATSGNREFRRGVSALMYSCQQGDLDSVRRVLQVQPREVFLIDRSGKTALHYCCTSGSNRAAQAADLLLMAAPELVDGRDEDGFTPLHLAVIAGNMPLVTFLLASKADVNAVDSEKHTVVHWATVCGETEALRAVLAAGAPVSTPDVHGGYPLHYAAQMCGGEKDYQLGFQVLQTLLSHQDISVTVADGDGRQPLLWAASAGSARAMLSLIRAGAAVEAPDKDGLTALHCAASRGHTDCLDTLLTLCGASVDVIDSNGCTALHYAVTLGHADATALLLAHGANANRQDRKGRSPAHCGCAKGQLETVKMLGSHGANLWLRNARGDLPLHEAAGSGRRELVKWLLEARPSQVNARNNDGRCPLHLAALNDNADMCKILLDLGAQINPVLRTSKNIFMTPLDCAMQRGFRSTAKYLQLQGGVPANRTGGPAPTSAVSLQIRDDVTFWGDSSTDSEEKTEINGEKRKRRSYKRKLAYRFERKRAGEEAATARVEDPKESEDVKKTADAKKSVGKKKSPRDKFTYTSEVKIIDDGAEEKIESTRPKSAKPSKFREKPKRKTKQDTPDPRRKETVPYEHSPSSVKTPTVSVLPATPQPPNTPCKSQQDINDNIREIESLAQTIEAKAKSICKEVNIIETAIDPQSKPLNPDIQSLTSYEDGEQHVNLVVEASVHPPPASLEDTYKDAIKSLREELETVRNEIKSMKSDDVRFVEKKIVEVTQNVKEEEVLKELKDLLEGRMREIKDTVEELKNDVKKSAYHPEMRDLDAIEIVGQEKSLNVSKPSDEEKLSAREEIIEEVSSQQLTVASNEIVDESAATIETKDEEKIAPEGDAVESDVIQIDESKAGIVPETLTSKSEEADTSESQKTMEVDQVQSAPSKPDDENISIEAEATPAEMKELAKEESIIETSDQFGEIIDGKVESQIWSTIANVAGGENVDAAILKVLGVDHSLEQSDSTQSPKLISKADSGVEEKDEPSSELPSEKRQRFLKSEKRDHHILLPRQELQESSLDAKSSEDDTSSGSSAATKREHKSFTVLEEAPASQRKKKIRSRSEESRLNERGRDRLRRNKGLDEKGQGRRAKSNLESRIPILPQLAQKTKSETNIADYSEGSEDEKERKRRVKRKSKARNARSAGSDYESSNLIDSGFEPSPRSSRIPKWKNVSERGVNMTSVTQSIQGNIRRYHLERKIFQHLLDLKRLQIRAGQHNESMLVKRAIDSYHRSCAATVGAGRYIPKDFSFKSFEQFLYTSLRKIQKTAAPEYLKGLPEAAVDNPLFCTQTTNRCMHATHAYTGIPCAAYLPKMDHHSIPKIGFSNCRPQQNFLPDIRGAGRKAVTLELCHGNDKQVISLPTDRLDQNKRYYVTFTVKGQADEKESEKSDDGTHRHSKSV